MAASRYGIMLAGTALLASSAFAIPRPAKIDFDGNGRSELAVFENGTWFATEYNGANYFSKVLGNKDSQLAPGVYEGGQASDLGVFNAGVWDVQARNEPLWSRRARFGFSGAKSVPGDFDGDGKTDLAVFAKGVWYILQSRAGYRQVSFGFDGGYPLAGNFVGDRKDDLVIVWDDVAAKQMKWAIYDSASQAISTFAYGPSGAHPVPGYYLGTSFMQAAVYWYNSTTKKGNWYIKGKNDPLLIDNGVGSPVGGCDFDGDGKDDIAVYNDGTWLIGMSTAGGKQMKFGYKGAKAVGAPTMRQASTAHQPIVMPKSSGVMDGAGGFLWKPVGESGGGNLVVLYPKEAGLSHVVIARDPAGTDVIERMGPFMDYERTRWRCYARRQGAGFGNSVYTVFIFNNGTLPKPYFIPSGANRWD